MYCSHISAWTVRTLWQWSRSPWLLNCLTNCDSICAVDHQCLYLLQQHTQHRICLSFPWKVVFWYGILRVLMSLFWPSSIHHYRDTGDSLVKAVRSYCMPFLLCHFLYGLCNIYSHFIPDKFFSVCKFVLHVVDIHNCQCGVQLCQPTTSGHFCKNCTQVDRPFFPLLVCTWGDVLMKSSHPLRSICLEIMDEHSNGKVTFASGTVMILFLSMRRLLNSVS